MIGVSQVKTIISETGITTFRISPDCVATWTGRELGTLLGRR